MNKTVKKLLMLIGVVAVFVVFCLLLNLRGWRPLRISMQAMT